MARGAACGICGAGLPAGAPHCPRCGTATAPPPWWPSAPVPHLLIEPALPPPPPPPLSVARELPPQTAVALGAVGMLVVVILVAWSLVSGDGGRLQRATAATRTTLTPASTTTVSTTTAPTTSTTVAATTTTVRAVRVLSELWRYDAADDLAARLAWDGVRIYGVTSNGRIFAIDPATGDETWSTRIDGNLSFQFGPVAGGGVVLVAGSGPGSTGQLLSFDGATGSPLWRFDLEQDVLDRPALVLGDRVVAIGRHVVALDLRTGTELWRANLSDLSLVSPTPMTDGARVYTFVFDTQLRLIGLDPVSGVEAGRPVVPTAELPSCSLLAGSVVCAIDRAASTATDLIAFDPATGQLRWRSDLPGRFLAPPESIADLIVVAPENQLIAVDAATGARRWAVPIEMSFATVEAGDRWLLLGALRLEVLDPASGELVAVATVDGLFVDPPVAAGPLALVQDLDGVVHAYALP